MPLFPIATLEPTRMTALSKPPFIVALSTSYNGRPAGDWISFMDISRGFRHMKSQGLLPSVTRLSVGPLFRDEFSSTCTTFFDDADQLTSLHILSICVFDRGESTSTSLPHNGVIFVDVARFSGLRGMILDGVVPSRWLAHLSHIELYNYGGSRPLYTHAQFLDVISQWKCIRDLQFHHFLAIIDPASPTVRDNQRCPSSLSNLVIEDDPSRMSCFLSGLFLPPKTTVSLRGVFRDVNTNIFAEMLPHKYLYAKTLPILLAATTVHVEVKLSGPAPYVLVKGSSGPITPRSPPLLSLKAKLPLTPLLSAEERGRWCDVAVRSVGQLFEGGAVEEFVYKGEIEYVSKGAWHNLFASNVLRLRTLEVVDSGEGGSLSKLLEAFRGDQHRPSLLRAPKLRQIFIRGAGYDREAMDALAVFVRTRTEHLGSQLAKLHLQLIPRFDKRTTENAALDPAELKRQGDYWSKRLQPWVSSRHITIAGSLAELGIHNV